MCGTHPARIRKRVVTAERLTDARLNYHRSDPDLVWSFGEQVFVFEIGGETVPRELIETLTGNRTACKTIRRRTSPTKSSGSSARRLKNWRN